MDELASAVYNYFFQNNSYQTGEIKTQIWGPIQKALYGRHKIRAYDRYFRLVHETESGFHLGPGETQNRCPDKIIYYNEEKDISELFKNTISKIIDTHIINAHILFKKYCRATYQIHSLENESSVKIKGIFENWRTLLDLGSKPILNLPNMYQNKTIFMLVSSDEELRKNTFLRYFENQLMVVFKEAIARYSSDMRAYKHLIRNAIQEHNNFENIDSFKTAIEKILFINGDMLDDFKEEELACWYVYYYLSKAQWDRSEKRLIDQHYFKFIEFKAIEHMEQELIYVSYKKVDKEIFREIDINLKNKLFSGTNSNIPEDYSALYDDIDQDNFEPLDFGLDGEFYDSIHNGSESHDVETEPVNEEDHELNGINNSLNDSVLVGNQKKALFWDKSAHDKAAEELELKHEIPAKPVSLRFLYIWLRYFHYATTMIDEDIQDIGAEISISKDAIKGVKPDPSLLIYFLKPRPSRKNSYEKDRSISNITWESTTHYFPVLLDQSLREKLKLKEKIINFATAQNYHSPDVLHAKRILWAIYELLLDIVLLDAMFTKKRNDDKLRDEIKEKYPDIDSNGIQFEMVLSDSIGIVHKDDGRPLPFLYIKELQSS